jgi:molecular chaperone GrpE
VSESVPKETEWNAEEPGSGAPGDLESMAEQWEAEKAELNERILRTQAEFQNFRRRIEKERLELSEYASM